MRNNWEKKFVQYCSCKVTLLKTLYLELTDKVTLFRITPFAEDLRS